MAGIVHLSAGATSGLTALYPPLDPCSEEDVSSFSSLDLSLRSHPELTREGPAVLNPEALAKLVDGIRTFQDKHLGRNSKSRHWPLVRLPDHIFRDRSRTGPLYAALISAYRTKAQSSWRNFDMGSNRRFDDNVSLLRRMEDDLTAAGFLRRPAIYLDESVPESRRGGMARTIERFGGKVVSAHTNATHVVAHDPALDGDANDGDGDPEKGYVRTVAVVKDAATGRKMTLAHWWFFPASYDEWIPSDEVAGDVAAEPRQAGPASEDGKWVVACRFVRDVAKFNEWGNEADYAIADYHSKVAIYKKSKAEPTKPKKKASSLTGGKKGSKSKSSDQISASADPSGGPSSSSSKASESERKRDRRAGSGMNPRPILTGFYSESGARIRRIVHDGALRVPPRAVGIVRDSLDLVSAGWSEEERAKWEAGGGSRGKRRVFELPSVDSVVRPSLDSSLGSTFLVTELSVGADGKTIVRNRRVPVLPNPEICGGGAERIRGGGGNESFTGNSANANASTKSTIHGTSSAVSRASVAAPGGVETNPSAETRGRYIAGHTSTESTTTQTLQADRPRGGGIDGGGVQSAGKNTNSAYDIQVAANAPTASSTSDSAIQASVTRNRPVTGAPAVSSPGTSSTSLHNQTVGSQQSARSSKPNSSLTTPARQTQSAAASKNEAVVVAGNSASKDDLKVIEALSVSGTLISAASGVTAAIPNTDSTADPDNVSGLQLEAHNSSTPTKPVNTAVSANAGAAVGAVRQSTTMSPSVRSVNAVVVAAAAPSENASRSKIKADLATSRPSAAVSVSSAPTTPPAILALTERPSQQQAPLPSAETEDSSINPSSFPWWYDPKAISDIEKTMLPEWFDLSSSHRTPESYVETRENIVSIGRRSQGRYVTATAVRRVVPGDAGSLLRLHSFLVQWGFLNGDALGDSAPTLPGLRKDADKASGKVTWPRLPDGKFSWTRKMRNSLAKSVVKFATKQQNTGGGASPAVSHVRVDWTSVAAEVGNGATPADCQGEFLSLSFDRAGDDASMDEAGSSDQGSESCRRGNKRRRVMGRRDIINELLDGVRPSVIATATNAAIAASNGNIVEAQRAAILGVLGSQAVHEARTEEDAIERILMEILDQRMMRLESRVGFLDDVEGMLEAERVALELERRDLYTARCRHWFSTG